MKKIVIYLLTLVATICLIGCKPTHQNVNGVIANEDYSVETIENLKAQDDDSVNVTFRIPFGTNIQAIINEFKDEFEREYPSVQITLDIVSGYDEMKKANINDINGGNAPTMTVGYPDHFAEYLISKSLVSLDKFINDQNVGYTQDELDDFLPGYISENRQFDKVGTYVGLPFNKSTEALFYNKDFFDNFNLEVPKTWDEYETTAQRIVEILAEVKAQSAPEKDGDAPKILYSWLGDAYTNLQNGEFIPCLYDSTGNLFTTIIHQFGGEYTSSIYKSNGIVDVQRGTIKFNTDSKAREALSSLQSLATEGLFNLPDAMDLQYGSYAFNVGKAVMNIGSTGGSSYYSTAICETGVAPIFYKDADHKYVIQQGTNVCIFSQASDLEKLAAWLFIKHMLTPENTCRFAMTTGYMPVRESSYELEEYLEFLDDDTNFTALVHKATANYASEGWNYFVDAAWSGSSTVRTEVGTAISQILIDKTSITTALEDAVKRIG